MLRFVFRHFTAILIIVVVAAWAIFYLPTTPAWTVMQLKRSIDARDGDGAANYVDFNSVVKSAGTQMLQQKSNDPLSTLLGTAALGMFGATIANLTKSWAVQQVNDGRKELQMPMAAVAGAIVLMHRDHDAAFTRWTDPKGQVYEVHLRRDADGVWRVSEVENVAQLLQKLQEHEQHQFNSP
jgi:hypothetical protein